MPRTTMYRHLRTLGVPVSTPPPDTFEQWVHEHVEAADDCLVWTAAVTAAGHPFGNFKRRKILIRREMWIRSRGPLRSSDEVYRTPTCPNRLCVALNHLLVDTARNRIKTLADTGVYAHGQAHWNAKLTEDEARDILTSHASVTELAARHHVSRSTIRAIQTGKRWRHLHA